jgi:ADP-ribosylglycohydrolase
VTTREDRIEGGLLGLLIGDALGVPCEFHSPREIPARWHRALRGRELLNPLLGALFDDLSS